MVRSGTRGHSALDFTAVIWICSPKRALLLHLLSKLREHTSVQITTILGFAE
jgi:hypothetical protein